jgi:hypothetical protein
MPSPVPQLAPICACSHGRAGHEKGAKCQVKGCGCGEFRLDPKATAAARSAAKRGAALWV